MMLDPKISIVTICKNAQDSIERTLTSVVSQAYANIEYIIVDGASTDKTLELVYNYREHITKIISEPDDGIYDGMNKGLRAASGDYIVFINAGDYLIETNVIKNLVRTIQSKALQNIDILYYCRGWWTDNWGNGPASDTFPRSFSELNDETTWLMP